MQGAAAAASTAALSTELRALCDKCSLDQPIVDVFLAKGIIDPLDVTLIGGDEAEFISALQDACGGTQFDILTTARRAKKLRALCVQASASPSGTPQTPSGRASGPDDEEPLPDGVAEAIEGAWVKKYHFHLTGHQMLIGSDFNRIFNCIIKKKPREVPKMDPEKMRLTSEGISGESKGLFLSEAGTVTAKKSYYSEIVAHDQLWWRIRAFLSTVAYVAILIDGFFSYQHCINFCDALHDVIMSPAGNSRLPIAQCKVAWKNMISALHVKVHQTSCTLGELTENEMLWKVHWCWQSGPRGVPTEFAPETPPANPLVQSLMDQNANLRRRLDNQGAGGGRRRSHGKGDGGSGKGGAGGKRWSHDDAPAGVPPPPPAEGTKRSSGMDAWSKRRANKQARKGGGKGGK